MRLLSSRGEIVILLSLYFSGIKSHFDTEIILIPFSISKDINTNQMIFKLI